MVRLLIEKGANVNNYNTHKISALTVAIKGGKHLKFVKLLLPKESLIRRNVFFCLGFDKVVELLIQKKANIKIMQNNGDTLLMLAATHGK